MVFLQNVIHWIYMIFAAVSCFFLVKQLFKREKNKGRCVCRDGLTMRWRL